MSNKLGWSLLGLCLSAALGGTLIYSRSAAGGQEDQLEKNKELVRQFGSMFGDAEHLESSAERYLTPGYIQHDPLASQGRAGFVAFFKQWYREHPQRVGAKPRGYVMMVAQGDMVVAVSKDPLPDPSHPGSTYDAFFFDMWRVQDGKLAEHWDDIKKCPDGGVKCYWP
jgi:predicted SnoaL-like aldol condensation-catalyzing enzyme